MAHFGRFGTITNAEIKSRGPSIYGFVEYTLKEAAAAALLEDHYLDGRRLTVEYSRLGPRKSKRFLPSGEITQSPLSTPPKRKSNASPHPVHLVFRFQVRHINEKKEKPRFVAFHPKDRNILLVAGKTTVSVLRIQKEKEIGNIPLFETTVTKRPISVISWSLDGDTFGFFFFK